PGRQRILARSMGRQSRVRFHSAGNRRANRQEKAIERKLTYQERVHAHLYIGRPSTRLTSDAVGVIELSWKPAFSKSRLYSSAVRSMPPGRTIITISKSLAKEGSFPVGTTASTIKSLPFFGITFRQLFRIWTDCSSFQS